MKDFEEISYSCYQNAMRLGYVDLTKDATIDHLQSEIEEIKESRKSPEHGVIRLINAIEDDEHFVTMFDMHCKGSEVFELIDIIFVALTRLYKIGVAVNTAVKCKLRYNRLRKSKSLYS
jgi:hypothetical protein